MTEGRKPNLFSNNFYDPIFEKKLNTFRKVQRFRRTHPLAKKAAAVEALGLSKNTVGKYWKSENEPQPSKYNSTAEQIRSAISKVADKDKDILNIILHVYLEGEKNFDCDLTFGKGDFYKELPYLPNHCYDKYPAKNLGKDAPIVYHLEEIDCPDSEGYIPDNSLSSIVIDLPQEISKSGKGSVGAFKSMTDLADTYNEMLKLAEKKLRYATPDNPGGLLIIKVGDIIHKGETIWLSQIVSDLAVGEYTDLSFKFRSKIKEMNFMNFELIDKFIHRYNEEEIDKKDNFANRSIKAHDYYLVFRKKGKDPSETFYFISHEECSGNKLKGDLMNYEDYAAFVEYRVEELREINRKNPNAVIYMVEISDRSAWNTLYKNRNAEHFKEAANRVLEEWKLKEEYKEYRDRLPLIFSRYAFESGQKLIDFINEKISDIVVPYSISRKDNPVHQKTASFLKAMGIKYLSIEYNPVKIAIINSESIRIKRTPMKTNNSKMKTDITETFFHGSPKIFDSFDLSHALEGDGQVKFGYGVYVTSSYKSAAHYSGVRPEWTEHYVYTVNVPRKTESNFIAFKQPVHKRIANEAAERLNVAIPPKALADGKEFRKFLASHLLSKMDLGKDLPKSVLTIEGEKAASEFLLSIGVDFIEWPYLWSNPELGTNRAILNDKAVEIVRIDSVEIDKKKQLIPNSEKTIR